MKIKLTESALYHGQPVAADEPDCVLESHSGCAPNEVVSPGGGRRRPDCPVQQLALLALVIWSGDSFTTNEA